MVVGDRISMKLTLITLGDNIIIKGDQKFRTIFDEGFLCLKDYSLHECG
jgi:hypothetical protein